MGRVFDFNTSRLCPAGCCAAGSTDRRPPRPPAPPAERGDADRAAIYGIYIKYMLLRSSDTDFVFFAFTGTRVATVGVFRGGPDGTVVSTTATGLRRRPRRLTVTALYPRRAGPRARAVTPLIL
jgi:hypothetical protein